MKREIPILITLVAGMFMLIAWFVPHPMVRGAYEGLQNWAIVVVGFTYVLGVANLLRINLRQVSRKERDWPYKIVLLAGLLVTMARGAGSTASFKKRNSSPLLRAVISDMSVVPLSSGFNTSDASSGYSSLPSLPIRAMGLNHSSP